MPDAKLPVLHAALAPFAAVAGDYAAAEDDTPLLASITVGDLRRAADAYSLIRPPATTLIIVRQIITAVACAYGLEAQQLTGPFKNPRFSGPRWIAMALARELTDASFPKIARCFGDRNHSTVMHAVQQVRARRAVDADYDREVRTLLDRLTEGDAR